MIKKKRRNFDELGKSLKAAGLIGAGEIADFGTAATLGTSKTLKEAGWEKKVLLGGLLGNLAAGVLDLDLPFGNLGIESMAGLDAFVDNASDIAIGVAGASLGYKAINNIQEAYRDTRTLEERLADLGLSLDDEEDEEPTLVQRNMVQLTQEQFEELQRKRQKPTQEEMTEEQELMVLKQLMAKYGNKLEEIK